MIMDCTPGNAADPEPPPHFILASWTALGEWLQVYGGGGLMPDARGPLADPADSFVLVLPAWETLDVPNSVRHCGIFCNISYVLSNR